MALNNMKRGNIQQLVQLMVILMQDLQMKLILMVPTLSDKLQVLETVLELNKEDKVLVITSLAEPLATLQQELMEEAVLLIKEME